MSYSLITSTTVRAQSLVSLNNPCGLLIMMAVFISTKSYVGDPIDCYPPKEFVSQWNKYVDNYCWNLYPIKTEF
ncbi:hypothetical protein EB796_000021 [Bugula neritina]|uniref:Innexin n=1 Tax=Bugula neritina TaxID=10212 RepID=A0A7J7KU85_BUGNE|nr:hypothetical protein EB796_000021 [Bugula neritina]